MSNELVYAMLQSRKFHRERGQKRGKCDYIKTKQKKEHFNSERESP